MSAEGEDISGHRRIRLTLLAALLVSGVTLGGIVGCGGVSGGEAGDGGRPQGWTLTVLAAYSLIDAFGVLANRFEEQNPRVKVKQSFESSSTLLVQIQQGAPAEVFASAAEEEMDTDVQDGLVKGEPEVFVRNREIIVVPKDNPARMIRFRDVAKSDVKLVLAGRDVPAADYALEILGKAKGEYGNDFEKDVLSNVVSRESDVRASVNRVVVGDADATFGYASDYTPDIRDKVKVVQIPPDLNIVATYPVATLEDAKSLGLAKKWVELVTSQEGQRVLQKWNFEPAA